MPEACSKTFREVEPFVDRLRGLHGVADPTLQRFFDTQRPVWLARAPGRLDVMGGIADYSGSLVLQLPIAEATWAAVQVIESPEVAIVSLPESGETAARCFSLRLEELLRMASDSYEQAGDFFRQDSHRQHAWAAYVVGVVLVLIRRCGIVADRGLRILIDSQVPEGKGVSSSAALEVAVMQALTGAFGLTLTGNELAHFCQEAENRVVGAPCGIMDQMTSAVGHHDQLLALLCQPAEVQGFVSIPASIRFWGIDSGIRHAVSGSDYSSVRTGAFMGYRILADLAGLPVGAPDASGTVSIDDPLWRGYLANVSPDEFTERFADRIPVRMLGADFLRQYGGTTDRVTRVDPSRTYAVRQPTRHPIDEHQRVRRFAELLEGPLDEASLVAMGQWMFASHASYSACGLGSEGTDRLVKLVRTLGPACGVYGAKITGGGSGGTVAVLGAEDAGPVVEDIAARYTRSTGRSSYVFSGSSCGARDFGVLRVDRCGMG
jgi:galactokinase